MAITPGGSLNSVASPQQQALASNYIDFTDGSTGWEQQYLPDLMEKEAAVFGNRTVSGFLSQVGAEEASASDQVVWSEQSRLHLSYVGTIDLTGDTNGTFQVLSDVDGNIAADGFTPANHGIRVNDVVLLASDGKVSKCLVVETPESAVVSLEAYDEAVLTSHSEVASAATLLVIGSHYGKGQSYSDITGTWNESKRTSLQPTFKSYGNQMQILKDYYSVSGSDASQVGWVEISAEDGTTGYMWYLKAEGDTRARFSDYMEMAMMESEFAVANSTIENATGGLGLSASTTGYDAGTEGLFKAIENRGHQTTGVTGVNAATDLAEFDAILAVFDQNGAIEENMMFVNRATALAMDDMLASMNSYGAGGTSYGVFDNEEDMALNLGFSGFRRGSYDFYKSDFKYLNDKGTRGALNDTVTNIRGVIIPAGTSTVYDEMLGKNLKRPFLHVRYRASQTESRKYKTWTTGSVGATTSGKDTMEVHYLTERCLVTQGANNFMLMN